MLVVTGGRGSSWRESSSSGCISALRKPFWQRGFEAFIIRDSTVVKIFSMVNSTAVFPKRQTGTPSFPPNIKSNRGKWSLLKFEVLVWVGFWLGFSDTHLLSQELKNQHSTQRTPGCLRQRQGDQLPSQRSTFMQLLPDFIRFVATLEFFPLAKAQ